MVCRLLQDKGVIGKLVRDTISYAGETILTIYHKGFDEEINQRKIKRTEKVGRYNLIFQEEVVEDSVIDCLNDWDEKVEGLLEATDKRNPYWERACAYMTQYSYFNKPEKIFSLQEDKYNLSVPIEHYDHMLSFIKKYTGLDLKDYAMCIGDVFVYECIQVGIRTQDGYGLIINTNFLNSRIYVNFKLDDIIIYTKSVTVQDDTTKEIEIIPDYEWDAFDIQIYQGAKLVYQKFGISFIRTMVSSFTTRGNDRRVGLNKLGRDYIIQGKEHTSQSIIGKKPDEIRSLMSKSNHSLRQRLSDETGVDDDFLFIKPSGLEKAKDYISNILRLQCDELWIFDPYFSDRSKIIISLDWIRILAYCKAANKHIVFFNKELDGEPKNTLTVDEFKETSLNDRIILDAKPRGSELGLHFYQIQTYIHDRFIFAIDGEKVTGITIGTSLNSLDRNYYGINRLSHTTSRKVFDTLKSLVDGENILDQASI